MCSASLVLIPLLGKMYYCTCVYLGGAQKLDLDFKC